MFGEPSATTAKRPFESTIVDVAERLEIDRTDLIEGRINPLHVAVEALCLCTEPHNWGGTCAGPAPDDTPIDSLLAAAISRLLGSANDPTSYTETGDGVKLSEEAFAHLVDPADLDFYLATLARALTHHTCHG